MRRILWSLRARTDGARVFSYWLGVRLDEAHHHADAEVRAQALADVALLTPVAKAFLTDMGHYAADQALQVWGGYGFVREYGIEQTVRDSRIAMIYEGTNEIQAIDLVQRKLLADGGRHAQDLAQRLLATAEAAQAQADTAVFATALRAQVQAWLAAVQDLVARHQAEPERAFAIADDMLHATGYMMMAWAWCRIALACQSGVPLAGARPHDEWQRSARYGIDWVLDAAHMHHARLQGDSRALPML
jgi:hypothetical protein